MDLALDGIHGCIMIEIVLDYLVHHDVGIHAVLYHDVQCITQLSSMMLLNNVT